MFHFNHYWKLKGKLTKKQTLTWEHQNFRNLKAPKGIDDKKKTDPYSIYCKVASALCFRTRERYCSSVVKPQRHTTKA